MPDIRQITQYLIIGLVRMPTMERWSCRSVLLPLRRNLPIFAGKTFVAAGLEPVLSQTILIISAECFFSLDDSFSYQWFFNVHFVWKRWSEKPQVFPGRPTIIPMIFWYSICLIIVARTVPKFKLCTKIHGSKVIRQWPLNWCTSPVMVH